MRQWWAIFEDSPNNEPVLVKEGALLARGFGGFKAVAARGKVGTRKLKAMWIIDPGSEQGDAIAISGRCPTDIRAKCNLRTKVFRMKGGTTRSTK